MLHPKRADRDGSTGAARVLWIAFRISVDVIPARRRSQQPPPQPSAFYVQTALLCALFFGHRLAIGESQRTVLPTGRKMSTAKICRQSYPVTGFA